MFSKFFKSPVSEETKEIITTFFDHYACDIFEHGIAKVCQLTDIRLDDKTLVVGIKAPFACDGALHQFAQSLLDEKGISVLIDCQLSVEIVKRHQVAGIKNIVAISSGKGGVGKSTTTVNLAYALQAEGATVGVLDADIYGPSIPKMFGLDNEKVTSADGKTMIPLEKNDISAMSIGFMVDESDATVWRGPMASRAFNQMLNETAWQDIDYLLIDMPPGTGDIQLTLAQQVPVAGAVIVTTPQDIALADAVKGVVMFNKVNVPVLGVVENMSYHICGKCGEKSHLFGQGGGNLLSEEHNTKLLGQLPLDISICQHADNGRSALVENSAGDIAIQYRRIAAKIARDLYFLRDDLSPQSNEIFIKQVD